MGEASAQAWLMIIGLGAVCGTVGQVVRMVIGLSKAQAAVAAGSAVAIDHRKIVVSIVIGAAAGAVAGLMTVSDEAKITMNQVLGLVAAGYAGADFIEGAMKKFVPSTS